MNFYKFAYKGIYEIMNLNLIRNIWYSKKVYDSDEFCLNDDSVITIHIEFTDGTMRTFDFSYKELIRFESVLFSSFS